MGIVRKFPKEFLTVDEFRKKLTESDMDVLDPTYKREPTEEECMWIRNKAHIEHWNKNPLTVADLVLVAQDMRKRLNQEGVRRHGNESIYRYEKRSNRWREIAETALRAVENAIEDKRKDEASTKRKGYH